jgi:hypothetical protein
VDGDGDISRPELFRFIQEWEPPKSEQTSSEDFQQRVFMGQLDEGKSNVRWDKPEHKALMLSTVDRKLPEHKMRSTAISGDSKGFRQKQKKFMGDINRAEYTMSPLAYMAPSKSQRLRPIESQYSQGALRNSASSSAGQQ